MYTYDKMVGSMLVRELTVDIGLGGEEITVIHLSDLHLHDCTEYLSDDPLEEYKNY